MPTDNLDGFRPEVIAHLKQLHSGFWRLPGGNFISDFDWYHSVGPRDKRPPDFDYAWNAMQTNDVGMDEFMTFCKLIGVEPYITVNAGFGDAHSAAEEVQYMNGVVSTPMGAMRAQNGHPEPYHVKFWDVGNEPYGQWQLGRTDLKYYLLKHNEFAKAMRAADPSITLLASGSMPEEAILEGVAADWHIPFDQAGICSDADWTCGFLNMIGGISRASPSTGIHGPECAGTANALKKGSRSAASKLATSPMRRRFSSGCAVRPIAYTSKAKSGRNMSSAIPK